MASSCTRSLQAHRWRWLSLLVGGVVLIVIAVVVSTARRAGHDAQQASALPAALHEETGGTASTTSSSIWPWPSSSASSTASSSSSSSSSKAAEPVGAAAPAGGASPALESLVPGEEAQAAAADEEEDSRISLPRVPGNLVTPGTLLLGSVLEAGLGTLIPECTPTTGAELRYLVENTTTCAIVTLQPGTLYVLDGFIRIKAGRRVSVIGRPLDMPTISAHRAYRAFTVERGGVLDLRFVRIYRGKPVRLIAQYYYEIRGGSVYIHAGGTATITSCLFTVNPELITEFLISTKMRATVRLIGGHILQEAGTLMLTDCHFYITRPGVLFREVYTVGGQILILAGNAVLTGCTFLSTLLFVNVIGVGDTVAVFGGTAIFTGCSFTFNCAFAASSGTGMLLFIGGGVAILTGCSAAENIGAHTFVGAGGAIFNGGGVTVMTGMSLNGAVSLLAGAGVGLNVAHGSGIFIKTGVNQIGNVAINAIAFLGIAVFVGSGVVVHSETVWSRVAGITSFYGGGGSLYNGAGDVTFINSFGLVINIIAFIAASGGHLALFAGWLTTVNCYFYKFEVIVSHYGQGAEILVVAGGAILINTGYAGGVYGLFAGNPSLVPIWISGHTVYLENRTYSGAFVTHDQLTYFPSAMEKKRRRRVALAQVTFTEYDPEEVGRVFGLLGHGMSVRSLQEGLLLSGDESSSTANTTTINNDSSSSSSNDSNSTSPSMTTVTQLEERPVVEGEVPLMKVTWPGMDVMIPALPLPDEKKTYNVYIADLPEECVLCGVKPGRTADNVDGKGVAACEVADTCDGILLPDGRLRRQSRNGEEEGEGKQENETDQMWHTPAGSARVANTSIAILVVKAFYNPLRSSSSSSSSGRSTAAAGDPTSSSSSSSFSSSISTSSVASAVQAVSQILGLPQRFRMHVATDKPAPFFMENGDEGEMGRALQEEEEDKGVDVDGECSETKVFRVYLVSDWNNVTKANVKGFQTEEGRKALQRQLVPEGEQGKGDYESNGSSLCHVALLSAVSLFVPGRRASSLFSADKKGEKAPAAADMNVKNAAASTQSPAAPTAQLLALGGKERIDDIERGNSYTLEMQHFPPATLLTINLVPRKGKALAIGTYTYKSTNEQGNQPAETWTWTVSNLIAPGAYFLEVFSSPSSSSSAATTMTGAGKEGKPKGGGLFFNFFGKQKQEEEEEQDRGDVIPVFAYTQAFEIVK